MPSQTCENAYILDKTRFSEKLKIDLKSYSNSFVSVTLGHR